METIYKLWKELQDLERDVERVQELISDLDNYDKKNTDLYEYLDKIIVKLANKKNELKNW